MTVDKVIAKIIWLTFLAHPVDTPAPVLLVSYTN